MQRTLGERLHRLRTLAGISARELSSLCGVAPGHVALIESGERCNPRSDTLQEIAEVTGVSLDWLVIGKGEAPSEEEVRAAIQRARASKPQGAA